MVLRSKTQVLLTYICRVYVVIFVESAGVEPIFSVFILQTFNEYKIIYNIVAFSDDIPLRMI